MAMHTQNLKADPRCSLFVVQVAAESDPLGAARATLVGNAEPVPEDDIATVREAYLARHENSRYWVEFSDFSFFRLQPVDLYYVGGFGVMGWVDAQDYRQATPDPLAEAASGILTHMNADHVVAMVLLAKSHAGVEANEATMTSVDRLGFTLRLRRRTMGLRVLASTSPARSQLRKTLVRCSSRWYGRRGSYPMRLTVRSPSWIVPRQN